MSERLRNALVLTAVLTLLLGAIYAISQKPTRLGLDLRGGVELVYQAKPTINTPVNSESVSRAIDIMRQRIDALGVSEPEIQNSNGNQIVVSLPNVTNAEEAARVVGTTAQLQFRDWEASVIGDNCKAQPDNINVTGGPNAGQTGGLSKYDALKKASKCPKVLGLNSIAKTKYYLVDATAKKVVAGPGDSERALRTSSEGKRFVNAKVITVKQGTLIVQAENPDPKAALDALGPNLWFVLRDDVAVNGTDIINPKQSFDNRPGGGGPNVTFEFTDKGARQWQDITRKISQRGASFVLTSDGQPIGGNAANNHFAIVLDDQLVSVPTIDFTDLPDGINGSNGSQISGNFTIENAQALANQLKYGALPLKLEVISQSQVSATLGQQALNQGLLAAGVGFAIVALFLLVFYRALGLLAVGALSIYAVYLYALIKLIPVTLTLPGLAGLVLTIGVCADANIVIFERVKEEVSNGRSVSAAIGLGYRKGLSTIIDANVVTLLTAFVLFMLSTSGVKGFALTLGLGVIVTLFSAVLATNALLGVTGSAFLNNPKLVGARTHGKKRRFDFNGATKIMFTISGIILLVGAFAISTKGIQLGIDFASGTRIQTALVKPFTENQVRGVLTDNGIKSADVQRVAGSELGKNVVQISTGELTPNRVNQINDALNTKFGASERAPQTQSVGPTFGASVAKSALIAIIASLLLIAVYIALRFEWKYAATTAISLMHDLLIVAGLYALTEREVTSATVAALLTVLGFSLYDTIIVNDRLRENIPRMPRATFAQISNRSMNEVAVRSISTVACASLPITALLIFGGETLQDFAFALLVGTVSGAYSSIFISSPVLTQWKSCEPIYQRREADLLARLGSIPVFAETGEGKKASALTIPLKAVNKEELSDRAEVIEDKVAPASGLDASSDDLVLKDNPRPKRKR